MTGLLHWFHLVGFAISFGSALALVFAVYPGIAKIDDLESRMQRLTHICEWLNPLFLFGLCIILFSGAFSLTNLKVSLGQNYFNLLLDYLSPKFIYMLLIFLFGSYAAFGLAMRLAKIVNGVAPGDMQKQLKLAKRLHQVTWLNIILLGLALYSALGGISGS